VPSVSSPPEHGLAPDVAALLVADAAVLGVGLDARQLRQLDRYVALLARWNSVHNLTAVDSPQQLVTHHLLDSLATVPTLQRFAPNAAPSLLDVGSGGGLPGIPLAIARHQWAITLIDKVAKKVAFLTQAKLELGLDNLEPVRGRVESLARLARFDLIISRAFSSLAEFTRLTQGLLAPGGVWIAMKGALPEAELAELARTQPSVELIETVKLDVPRLAAERHLLVLKPR